MNIKISDSWLREFIETKATPKQIREYLSSCSQSVEKITQQGKEIIYDIEITTNRPDCLSVLGIARELSAILPRFSIKAAFTPIMVSEITAAKKPLPLNIKIEKSNLCPRFTALVFDEVKIKPSPDFVQKRLENAGIRSLNNVIDISNYLMSELGQPMHTFDYDKILGAKMLLRESKKGESLITLDGQKRVLPEGTIIIEDGEGRVIDLCGIMGGKNSEVDQNTKRVLLFIQTYDPAKIRKTCQNLSFRTEAAARFEKGIDPEGVLPAMKRATLLFEKWCGAKVGSKLFDIYPNPPKIKKVFVSWEKINQILGVTIKPQESKKILESLSFEVSLDKQKKGLTAVVPHWRNGDINLPEDLIEEIARLYGYHKLPNLLPPIADLNQPNNSNFELEEKIKLALKYWGFTETASYSLISKKIIEKAKLKTEEHLKLSNPLTEDLVYLRTSLIPSLLQTIESNQQETEIKIFEMANIYLPQGSEKLPEEKMTLCLAQTNEFYQTKGVIEALLTELGIASAKFLPGNIYKYMLLPSKSAEIFINNELVGFIGEIEPQILDNFQIRTTVTVASLDLEILLKYATKTKKYNPLPKYPPVIEDFSFEFPPNVYIGPLIESIKGVDPLIVSVNILDSYENTRTFRITYQNPEKNLSDKEVELIRREIVKRVEKELLGKLRKKD